VAFLIFPQHHFSTMAALYKACSSLEFISCFSPPIVKESFPSLYSMTLTPSHPTPREGVYAAISVRDIINIPSSTKKYLIHRGISLTSLPLAPFLKISSPCEKDWWFSAANSIMYRSIMMVTQKSMALMTGESNLWSDANLSVSQA
jgi:hypothetical protein